MIPRRFSVPPPAQRPGIGPRRPEPHPDGTIGPKLVTCPRCRNKGVLFYYAPTELGYYTECVKCGGKYAFRTNPEMTPKDVMRAGGFTPQTLKVHHHDPVTKHPILEASKLWTDIIERRSMGWNRWRRLGKTRPARELVRFK